MKQNAIWISAYIYSDPPHEELLVEGVLPVVKKVMDAGLASQYFFIRYFEKGHHVRLRCKTAPENEGVVREMINKGIGAYFVNHPGKQEKEKEEYYPPQSIQYIPYEPEIARYGGEERIGIAEEQFMYSSDVVFSLLSKKDNWQYEKRLGYALQLAVAQFVGFGFSYEQVVQYAQAQLPGQLSYHNLKREDIEKQYEKQRELKGIGRKIYNALQQVQDSDGAVEKYVQKMQNILQKLKEVKTDTAQLQRLLPSYIHMTNNRLGIKLTDEAYITFLLQA